MIILLLFFVTIFATTFAFGDLFLKFFECIGLKTEKYIVVDRVFLGLFVLVFLASVLNFWIPINIYVTVPVFLISVVRIIQVAKKQFQHIQKYKKYLYCGLFVLVVISFLSLIIHDTGDSMYYHMQFIESIYQYPIIKGLGNLEDRYGFNSSIFLFYPMVSFKFFLKFHLFGVNYFLYGIILWYILCKIIEDFSLLNVCYLFFLSVLYYIDFINISSTTNDTTVALCGLFLTMRFLSQKMNVYLLYIFIPCLMVTTKLSSGFFIFLSLFTIIYLFKKQNSKLAWTSITICFVFLFVWLVRNVFISGYIVYPFYYLDLFDFSWKVPRVVAMIEKEYIQDYAFFLKQKFFDQLFSLDWDARFVFLLLMHIFLLSIPVAFVILYKQQKKAICLILSIFTLGLIFTFIMTPDSRFYASYLYSIIFILMYCFINEKLVRISRGVNYSLLVVSFLLLLYTFIAKNDYNFNCIFDNARNVCRLFYRPISDVNIVRFRNPDQLKPLKVNNFEILINLDNSGMTYYSYECFLSSSATGYPNSSPILGFKIQALETIEMNSEDIKDGYKTTNQWKKIFENNETGILEQYKLDMNKRLYNR